MTPVQEKKLEEIRARVKAAKESPDPQLSQNCLEQLEDLLGIIHDLLVGQGPIHPGRVA